MLRLMPALVLALLILVPYALAQCTGCKRDTEWCDTHQADGRGRCESCEELCFPGQGNEAVCQSKCPDFHKSGAAGNVEPGKAALNLSRSNAQAVSALNVSLNSMAEHNRNSSLHVDQTVQNIHSQINSMAPFIVVGIVLSILSAILFSALVAYIFIKCRRDRRIQQDAEKAIDEEQRKPIKAEEEKSRDQPAEICTGQQNTTHPTGVADDLHPNQKESRQRPEQFDNEFVPSGRTCTDQNQHQTIPKD